MKMKKIKIILILIAKSIQLKFLVDEIKSFEQSPAAITKNKISLIREFEDIRLGKRDMINLSILDNFEYNRLHNVNLKESGIEIKGGFDEYTNFERVTSLKQCKIEVVETKAYLVFLCPKNRLVVYSRSNNKRIQEKILKFEISKFDPEEGKITSSELLSAQEFGGKLYILSRIEKSYTKTPKKTKTFLSSKILELKNIEKEGPPLPPYIAKKPKFKTCNLKAKILKKKISKWYSHIFFKALVGILTDDKRVECQGSTFLIQKIEKNFNVFFKTKIYQVELPIENLGQDILDMSESEVLGKQFQSMFEDNWLVVTRTDLTFNSKICGIFDAESEIDIECLDLIVTSRLFNSEKREVILKLSGDFLFVIFRRKYKRNLVISVIDKNYLYKGKVSRTRLVSFDEFGLVKFDKIEVYRNSKLYSLNFFNEGRIRGFLLYNSEKEIFKTKMLNFAIMKRKVPLGRNFIEVYSSGLKTSENGDIFLKLSSGRIQKSVKAVFNFTTMDTSFRYREDLSVKFELKIILSDKEKKIEIPENLIPTQTSLLNSRNAMFIRDENSLIPNFRIELKKNSRLKMYNQSIRRFYFSYYTTDIQRSRTLKIGENVVMKGKYLLNFNKKKSMIEKYSCVMKTELRMTAQKNGNFYHPEIENFAEKKFSEIFIEETFFMLVFKDNDTGMLRFLIGMGVNRITKVIDLKIEFEDYVVRKKKISDEITFQLILLNKGNLKIAEFLLINVTSEILRLAIEWTDNMNSISLDYADFNPKILLKDFISNKKIRLISKKSQNEKVIFLEIITINHETYQIEKEDKTILLYKEEKIICGFGEEFVVYNSKYKTYSVFIPEHRVEGTEMQLGMKRYEGYRAKCFRDKKLFVLSKIGEKGEVMVELFNTSKILKSEKRILNSLHGDVTLVKDLDVQRLFDEDLMLLVKHNGFLNFRIWKFDLKKRIMYKSKKMGNFTEKFKIFYNDTLEATVDVNFETLPKYPIDQKIDSKEVNRTYLKKNKFKYRLENTILTRGHIYKIKFLKSRLQFKNTSIRFKPIEISKLTPKTFDFALSKFDDFSIFNNFTVGLSIIGMDTTLLTSYVYEKNTLIGRWQERLEKFCKNIKFLENIFYGEIIIFAVNCLNEGWSSEIRVYLMNVNSKKTRLLQNFNLDYVEDFFLFASEFNEGKYFIDIVFKKGGKRVLYEGVASGGINSIRVVELHARMNLFPGNKNLGLMLYFQNTTIYFSPFILWYQGKASFKSSIYILDHRNQKFRIEKINRKLHLDNFIDQVPENNIQCIPKGKNTGKFFCVVSIKGQKIKIFWFQFYYTQPVKDKIKLGVKKIKHSYYFKPQNKKFQKIYFTKNFLIAEFENKSQKKTLKCKKIFVVYNYDEKNFCQNLNYFKNSFTCEQLDNCGENLILKNLKDDILIANSYTDERLNLLSKIEIFKNPEIEFIGFSPSNKFQELQDFDLEFQSGFFLRKKNFSKLSNLILYKEKKKRKIVDVFKLVIFIFFSILGLMLAFVMERKFKKEEIEALKDYRNFLIDYEKDEVKRLGRYRDITLKEGEDKESVYGEELSFFEESLMDFDESLLL